MHPRFVLIGCALAGLAPAAHAQSLAPFTATLTAGGGHFGGGAALRHRGGYALDAMLVARRASGLLVAVGAGLQGPLATNDRCDLAPGGGCLQNAPTALTLAALVGWEASRATLRVLAGPAFVDANGARGVGLQGRVDVATPRLGWVAPTLSFRATLVPQLDGEARRVVGVGLGLRIR